MPLKAARESRASTRSPSWSFYLIRILVLARLSAPFAGIALSQYTGILAFDSIASIFIGLILIGTSIWLAYETKGLLIGESANRAAIQAIREILNSNNSIEHVNEVLTMHMGPDFILANISVDFDDSKTADEIETTVAEIDSAIKEQNRQIKRVFIEAEKRTRQVSG